MAYHHAGYVVQGHGLGERADHRVQARHPRADPLALQAGRTFCGIQARTLKGLRALLAKRTQDLLLLCAEMMRTPKRKVQGTNQRRIEQQRHRDRRQIAGALRTGDEVRPALGQLGGGLDEHQLPRGAYVGERPARRSERLRELKGQLARVVVRAEQVEPFGHRIERKGSGSVCADHCHTRTQHDSGNRLGRDDRPKCGGDLLQTLCALSGLRDNRIALGALDGSRALPGKRFEGGPRRRVEGARGRKAKREHAEDMPLAP